MDPALIEEFKKRGVVVVPGVLSAEEVLSVREGFQEYLFEASGFDASSAERLGETAASLGQLSSTGGAGGILDIFWADFKMPVLEHAGVVAAFSALWQATFASGQREHFEHDYGAFDASQPVAAVDRVCFRLPDALSAAAGTSSKKGDIPLQRHLAPHLDCCPHSALGPDTPSSGTAAAKWRPVQAFVSLVDTGPEQGGFECCPSLHREFHQWAASRPPSISVSKSSGKVKEMPPPCLGAFTPMRPKEDADVLARFESVPCQAGDLVLWDNRLPHANSRCHSGAAPREVVYVGLLPPVPQNLQYATDQLQRLRTGRLPADFWHGKGRPQEQRCKAYRFSQLGRRLLRMPPDDAPDETAAAGSAGVRCRRLELLRL